MPTIRVETRLVLVDALVLDKKTRRPVDGLEAGDFVLFEDGIEQKIAHFSRDQFPLAVLLMVDTSTSVQSFTPQIHTAVLNALDLFREGDKLALMSFAGRTHLVQGFTDDRSALAGSLKGLYDGGEVREHLTWLNNCLYQAADYMRKATDPGDRRIILAISDNEEAPLPSQGYSRQQASDQLAEGDITVGTVLMGRKRFRPRVTARRLFSFFRRKPYKSPYEGDLKYHGERTGGIAVASHGKIDETLVELIRLLRARYTIGYYPLNTDHGKSFREIRVSFSRRAAGLQRKASIRARDGYVLTGEVE